MLSDVKFAIRTLLKNPAFTLTCIGILGLGIGATTAVLSVVNSVLLRPLPFPESDRLVNVWNSAPKTGRDRFRFSYPEFQAWKRDNKVFEGMAAFNADDAGFITWDHGVRQLVPFAIVSSELFNVLRVEPVAGPNFGPGDNEPGRRPVAIISYDLWMSRFGGRSSALGTTIEVEDKKYEIIGAMPAGFQFPIQSPAAQLWLSIGSFRGRQPDGSLSWLDDRGEGHDLKVVARLRSSVTTQQAQADGNAITHAMARQYPAESTAEQALVVPLLADLTARVGPALWILLGAATSLLIVGCLNVANLLLARGLSRQREIGIRAALGAMRWRIIRQLLTEALILALCGGAIGVLVAFFLTTAFRTLLPTDFPRIGDIKIDAVVLAASVGVSLLTGVLFGLSPAWRFSLPNVSSALGETSMRSTMASRSGRRTREVLIVIELALSLALLGAASLLIQSFWRLLTIDPGFAPDHIVSAQLALPSTGYSDKIEQINALNGILEAARRLPGMADISGTESLPLSGYEHSSPFQFEGEATPIAECPRCSINEIFPGYFATMRIRLLQGRDFTGTDDATHPAVVIINQRFAKQFFPGQNPIGRRVGPGLSGQDAAAGYRLFQIIGIVNDFGPKRLDSKVSPTMYVPYGQSPNPGFSAVVRTSLTQHAVEANLRRAADQIDKSIAIYGIRTMDRRISDSVAQPRVNTAVISTFAALAIILTATGLYGVMSYSVAQRTQEIGVRLALGASTRNVLQLIIGQGMRLVWIGLAIGISLSFTFNPLISSLLFGIQPTDIPTLLTVTVLLAIVALVALWLPAHRASRIDPVIALRREA